jgi:penicillin-binding protein 2
MFVRSMMNSTGENRTNYLSTLENTMILSEKAQSLVTQGMEEVVSGKEGTARASRIPDIRFGGKTGTAQVVNLEVWKRSAKKVREFEDHALFVGTAPMENPRIAVAVIVEHGGQGSRSAAPIAKKMIQYYLKKETAGGNDGTVQN